VLVIDASAAIEILIGSDAGSRWRDSAMHAGETLQAPHIIDIEVTSGLRRLASLRVDLAARAGRAVEDFSMLHISRHGHLVLLPRIWDLRHNISAYDAAYVALAETLDVPLLTGDSKLSRSQGHNAKIVLLQ
jgi:predicted nucleic acid-binding protein